MSSQSTNADTAAASIILNVMANTDIALYGFRSWLLQDFERPYEIVLNLFNEDRPLFDAVLRNANPNCRLIIKTFPAPEYFNISASNNLGLHFSSGKYAIFANADIIYRGDFLTRAIWEFENHNFGYAVAARVNLLEKHCAELKPPLDYSGSHAFDFLSKHDLAHGVSIWPAISPWMIRRDIAFAVGGFDARVLVAEDRDIDQRVTHFLRRQNLQQSHISFCNLRGYHQHHESLHAFDAFSQSKAIIEPRQERLAADINSTDDVVATMLNDLDALMKDIRETKKPPLANRYSQDFSGRVTRRVKDVWKTILHGR